MNRISEGNSVWSTVWENKKNFCKSSFSNLTTIHSHIISSFRYGVSFKNISWESKSLTGEMTAPRTETTLSRIRSGYSLENVFNADEFGLFYQCLPNYSFLLKREKYSGGKQSKFV